jgi:hypothetical protein
MRGSLTALLGALGLMAAFAPACRSQSEKSSCCSREDDPSCCITSYIPEGKHLVRKQYCPEPFEMPTTTFMKVTPGQQQPGDAYAYVTHGKRTTRIYLREVPILPEYSIPGTEYAYRYRPEGKTSMREEFTIIHGAPPASPETGEPAGLPAK